MGERHLARAMAYFPVVGLLLGSLAALIHALSSLALAAPLGDLVSLAFLIVVTGNMHADGLMDAADGIFSRKPRERVLEIMRDSRVGSHGVMAGWLVLLAKFVLLGQIPLAAKGLTLALVPALGRWAQVYAATVYPYARSGGGTGTFTGHVGVREISLASATALLAVLVLLGYKGIILAGAALAGTALLGRYVSRRIGGMTGDTLGAVNECIEVLSLMTMHIILRA